MKQLEAVRDVFRDHTPEPIGLIDRFSVLIPLIEGEDGELRILYETRASKLDAQPGEICFPGGAVEEGEALLDCALRETFEEIGVREEDIEIMGPMDTLNNAGFSIFIFVGLLKNVWAEIVRDENGEEREIVHGVDLSSDEVEEVFTIPLSYFLTHKPDVRVVILRTDAPEDFPYERIGQTPDYKWLLDRYSVYIYDWPGRYLWGMTAKMTDRFASLVAEKL